MKHEYQSNLNRKFSYLIKLLKNKNFEEFISIFKCRLLNKEICLGLYSKIDGEFNFQKMNRLKTEILDGHYILQILQKNENRIGIGWIERRKRLILGNIGRAYVTFFENKPCHFQWVFDSNDNKLLSKYYTGEYPHLTNGDAILEHALTIPNYRRKGIHTQAHCQIINSEIKQFNNNAFLSFINPQNIPSLKVAINQGFKPTLIRKEIWFLNTHKFIFEQYEKSRYKNLDSVIEKIKTNNYCYKV